MFGLGFSEILLLGILALIVIGPKQLPDVARMVGRFINDLKRSTEDLTSEIKRQAKADFNWDDQSIHQNKTQEKLSDENYLHHIQPPMVEENVEKSSEGDPEQMSFEETQNQKKNSSDV